MAPAKERAQVSDENFDNALKQLEPPTGDENYLSYRPTEEIKILRFPPRTLSNKFSKIL